MLESGDARGAVRNIKQSIPNMKKLFQFISREQLADAEYLLVRLMTSLPFELDTIFTDG
jgi:hypothetical protein